VPPGSSPGSSGSPGLPATTHAGLDVHAGACVLSAATVSSITGESFAKTGAMLANNKKFHECGYGSKAYPDDSFVTEVLGSAPSSCRAGQDGATVQAKPNGCVIVTDRFVNQLGSSAHLGTVAVQLTLTLGTGTAVDHTSALAGLKHAAGEIYAALADKTYRPPPS
jgi:hypothetical protein